MKFNVLTAKAGTIPLAKSTGIQINRLLNITPVTAAKKILLLLKPLIATGLKRG